MKEDFVGYDLAVKLKEKGFDSFCENGYFLKNGIENSLAYISSPLKYIEPESALIRPLRCWIRVDLPEPVWPIIARNSPS